MRRKRILVILAVVTVLLTAILLLENILTSRERENEALAFRRDHSLFETLVFSGGAGSSGKIPGSAGTGASAAKEDGEPSQGTSEAEAAGGQPDQSASAEDAGGQKEMAAPAEDAGGQEDQAASAGKAAAAAGTAGQQADLPPVSEEVRLIRRRETRWVAYLPADLSDRAYVCFSYFDRMDLESLDEEEKAGAEGRTGDGAADGIAADPAGGDDTGKDSAESPGILSFHNGDLFRASDLKNGSHWRASLRDRKGEILEEAELLIYRAEPGSVPTLYLDTASGSMDAVNADKTVREEGRYVFYTEAGIKDASGRCRIHGRGNSSWKEDKKQYSLNLASARNVLGMESSEKFALVANHSDASNLRNKAVYDLAGMAGMPSSPESVFVNVYFNGTYNGLYLLAQRPNARGGSVHIHDLEARNREALAAASEKQTGSASAGDGTGKTGSAADADGNEQSGSATVAGRTEPSGSATKTDSGASGEAASETVDLVDEDGLEIHASAQEPVPDNITGGYLLEMDGRYEDETYWFSTDRHHFVVKYPEAIPLKEEKYIAAYVRAAERAFYSEDGRNPRTGKSWREYMDLDSWAKMYIMQDFMAQWDVESFSFFVYKDADDPLLYCGPVWDFDLSMGATGLGRLPNVMQRSMWLRDHREGWLTQLESFPVFSEAVDRIFKEEFCPALEKWLEGFDVLSARLETSAAMDCHVWHEDNEYMESALSLRSWLQGRMAFLQDYTADPQAFCRVTLRYGFSDMDIYVRRGDRIGFVPVEKYGEYLYGSFRRKYGEIGSWTAEDGSLLTEDTVIDRDMVFVPQAP